MTASEARHVLRQLPYEYQFRPVPLPDGANGALAGRVRGPHDTSFEFSIALGRHPGAVPDPQSGTANAVGVPVAGFVFNDNILIKGRHGNWVTSKEIHTAAQSTESSNMHLEIEEKLCRAATGKPCPV